MAKKRRINKTTLIIVGEGEHDNAFLRHMKGIYDSRESGQKVKIDFSSGGSPYDIIKDTVKKTRHIAYDREYILMDADVVIKQQDRDYARKNNISILLSEPICLEGMLLDVLEQMVPATAEKCKKHLHPQLSGEPTEPTSYGGLFSKIVLDKTTKETIVDLRKLLANKK